MYVGGGVIYEREGKILQSKGEVDSFEKDGRVEYKDYQHICGYTAFIFKRKLLTEHSIYFPNYRRFQDVPFIVNVMIHAKFFYAVSKSIYVYRMVDKLIPYHDENVINGIAQGIDDVLLMSGKARFETLHTDIVQKMINTYIDWFYKSIYNGNKILKELLQKIWNDIDEELLLKDGRVETKPIFKSEEEIKDYISKNRESKENFWRQINSFKRIIIYGAGVAGKRLFKFIMSNGYKGIVEFAVSDLNPEGTACGKQIRSIDSYIEYKNDALVLIAIKGDGCYTMLDRARKLGYCNTKCADYTVISF